MGPALLLVLAAGLHPQDGPDADVRLTVEPGAVRLAVTLNLVFLDEYVEPFREHDHLLHPVEHGLAQDLGFELLEEATTLRIDGITVQPRVQSFEVADPDPELIPHFPRFGTRAMTKLRWVLEYPVKSAPGEVDLTWTLFPPDEIRAVGPDIPTLEIVAHVKGEGRAERITLTEDGNRIRWVSDPDAAASRFLEVPEAPAPAGPGWPGPALLGTGVLALLVGRRRPALALVGVAVLGTGLWWQLRPRTALAVDAASAARIFEPLHQNLYRAFDYSQREDVYDALAQSVSGDLLRELYEEVRASLVQTEQGGAVSEVQAVRRLSTDVTDLDSEAQGHAAFRLETRWQVDGAVFHFGHSHWRTNEYGARVAVALTDEGWRLAEHEIFLAERVDSAPIPPDEPAVASGEREEDEFLSLLASRGLRFAFGEGGFSLRLDELDLAPGESLACIGPSGCGKTTLIRLLTGQLVPDAGEVTLDGSPLSRLSEEARRARRLREIGLVFQDFALLDYLDARENLLLPYRLSAELVLDAQARQRAEDLARSTGVADLLGRKPRHLSQGERQRIALCRALVTAPKLVVADEPTGNLDPDTAGAAVDRLFEEVSARGASLLVVTHDHALLPRFDRVLDLGAGA